MTDQRGSDARAASIRIAGFRVQASPTVFVLFALIAYTAAQGLLPAAVPGLSGAAYWAGGAIAALFVMGSLLVHELSHAVVARRHGLTVESVTFWLFGGVARFGGQAPSPRAEWRIAAIGPTTNLLIAGVGYGVAAALSALSAPDLAIAVAGYVVGINVLLGVFNLVPAAPLDGGRVLHSLLWRRSGDRDRATVTSAVVGQGIAAVIVGLGIFEFAAGSLIGGLWTALIGWFLFAAARNEARQTVTRSALEGLHVRDVLPPATAPAAPAWHSVAAFLQDYQAAGDTRTVVPLRSFDGEPAGLVSLPQLGGVPADRRDTTRLSAVGASLRQVVVTNPDEPLIDLVERLRPPSRDPAALRLAGHALVVRDGAPVGVVTPSDLARATQLAKLRGPRPPSPPPAPSPSPSHGEQDDGPPRRSIAA